MENVFSVYKKRIEESISSIFTKDDVLKLIEHMEQNTAPVSKSQAMDKIVERLRDIKSDVVGLEVDHDDVEFNVNGKTIEVYDVTINGVDDISRDIESLIDDIEEGKID